MEEAAKHLGLLLRVAGCFLLFFVEERWRWGGFCWGFGCFFSYLAYRNEAERLRKDLELLASRGTPRSLKSHRPGGS